MSQPLTQTSTSLYPLRCPGKKEDEGVVETSPRKAATGTPAKWEGYYAGIRATKRKPKGWRQGIVIQELGHDLLRVFQKEVAVMAKMTPSEAIVETLLAEGVDQLSGIVGSTFMDMLDLFPTAGIRFIPVRHEQNETQEEAQVPFTELLRTQPKELLLGMSTRWIEGLVFNAYGVFILTTSVAEEPEAAVEKS
jgi:hypothetical protein